MDKVDYLQRDALQCAVNIGCDFQRLLQLTKVWGRGRGARGYVRVCLVRRCL